MIILFVSYVMEEDIFMTKSEWKKLIDSKNGLLFLDGATGTNLMKAGMPAGVCPEQWILEHPDIITTLQKELSKEISVDYLVSRGEYLTSKLMAEYLNYTFVDASEIVKFNYDGTVDQEQTYALTLQAVQKYNNVVIPGFYGAYPNGTIKTFSRGGSDITGALVARSINASEYENWTDVSGVLIADPRIIKGAKSIKEITYSELRELSYMGASVLHEETIFPVQELNIPIHIKNTNAPLDEGTIITNESNDTSQIITGIAGKKNYESITIIKKQKVQKLKEEKTVKFEINKSESSSEIRKRVNKARKIQLERYKNDGIFTKYMEYDYAR